MNEIKTSAVDSEQEDGQTSRKFDLRPILSYRFSLLSNRLTLWASRTYGSKFDVTSLEWRTIAPLGRYGPLTASEIVDATVMDKSNVSRAIKRLMDRGFIRRRPDSQDRRRQVVELTDAGQDIYERIAATSQDRQNRLIEVLSDAERAEFLRLLEKLEARAEELLGETEAT